MRYDDQVNTLGIVVSGVLVVVLAIVLFFYFPGQEGTPPPNNTSLTSSSMEQQIPGLTVLTITEGVGVGATSGQTVVVDYMGMLTDGTVFDSSIPRGQPFTVHLGRGEVIRGWDLGIVGMKVGEVRKLTISPELGYGKDGFPGVIPPEATLIFEVTLRAIK